MEEDTIFVLFLLSSIITVLLFMVAMKIDFIFEAILLIAMMVLTSILLIIALSTID